MKLTLQPTDPTHGPKIAISVPFDDQTIHDLLDDMIIPALVAQGFHPQTIQDSMRDVTVPGAREATEDLQVGTISRENLDRLKELAAGPVLESLPEGFEVIGYSVDDEQDDPHPVGDLLFLDGETWTETAWANGGGVWYAARVGSATHDTLTNLGKPMIPNLPPLPPVPEGYSGWSTPVLVPVDTRVIEGRMAFFHESGLDEDAGRWWLSDSGTFGDHTDYPIYFIEAITQ